MPHFHNEEGGASTAVTTFSMSANDHATFAAERFYFILNLDHWGVPPPEGRFSPYFALFCGKGCRIFDPKTDCQKGWSGVRVAGSYLFRVKSEANTKEKGGRTPPPLAPGLVMKNVDY